MKKQIARYRVFLPAHSTSRDVATLHEAMRLARGEARDGWEATRIERLENGRVLYRFDRQRTLRRVDG